MASPSSAGGFSTGAKVITALVVVLLILHQDNWFWDNDTLVFGFIPMGLFYHACISIAAATTWLIATFIAWPHTFEDSDVSVSSPDSTHSGEPTS